MINSKIHFMFIKIGGATALIGDPSGKSSERIALPEENVKENTNVIGENITRIFQNHEKYIWEKNRGPLKPVKYNLLQSTVQLCL